MTVWPVLERELRVRARAAGTYWIRLPPVLIGGAACIPQLLWGGFAPGSAAIGKSVFVGLVTVAFLVACSAVFLTANAVSRERREGTLELLLLTRVRTLDVVLGKLGSAGIAAMFGLAAFVPLLMITVLAGGVTGWEVARMGLALLNTLFLTLCIGLWASSSASETRHIWGRIFLLFLIAFVAPLFCDTILEGMYVRLSPIETMIAAGHSLYRSAPVNYWLSLCLVSVLACGLLLHAGRVLLRSVPDTSPLPIQTPEIIVPAYGTGSEYLLPNVLHPIDFLVTRQTGVMPALLGMALIELGYYGLAGVFYGSGGGIGAIYFTWPIWIFSSLASDALLAKAAGRFFLESRRSGALELVQTTPIGAREILSGQWRALKSLLGGPVMLVFVGVIIATLAQFQEWTMGDALLSSFAFFVSLALNGCVTLAGIAAICWVAMWLAFKGHRQMVIITRAVGVGTVLPGAFRVVLAWIIDPLLSSQYGQWPWLLREWAEELVVLAFYLWLFRFARRRLHALLPGAELP